jgi:hypothetical protein
MMEQGIAGVAAAALMRARSQGQSGSEQAEARSVSRSVTPPTSVRQRRDDAGTRGKATEVKSCPHPTCSRSQPVESSRSSWWVVSG